MNTKGHPKTLEPSQPGNLNALRSGAWSPRALAPRAAEVAEAIMALPHILPSDRLGAEETGRMQALIEAIDDELQGGLLNGNDEPKALIDLRLRASGKLERWCAQLGLTPVARAAWVTAIAHSETLAETVQRIRERREGGE